MHCVSLCLCSVTDGSPFFLAWETGESSLQALESTKSLGLALWEPFAPLHKWDWRSGSTQAPLDSNYTSPVILESPLCVLAVNNIIVKVKGSSSVLCTSDHHTKELRALPEWQSPRIGDKMVKMSNSYTEGEMTLMKLRTENTFTQFFPCCYNKYTTGPEKE